MRLALSVASCLAVLIVAPVAQAAQRYAAPSGTGGEPCAQSAPCSLKDAVTNATAGSEVVVTAGTYPVESISAPMVPDVSIHGETGGPMPKIVATTITRPIAFSTTGGRLAYLEIENNHEFGEAVYCFAGGAVERVRVKVSGDHSRAVAASGCTVRDSLLQATGTDSIALFEYASSPTSSSLARNLTAIATGGESVAVRSSYIDPFEAGSFTLSLKNSIAIGEGVDLQTAPGSMGSGSIEVSNSSYDSVDAKSGPITPGGGNQTAAPLFVDAAKGDYREAAGSPTIDAGVADQLGPLDLAGGARVQGPAPDIGAYETAGPAPPAPELRSLVLSPTKFRAANIGGAVISRKKTRAAPVGSTVVYGLSSPATVGFSVERAVKGRRVGRRCKGVTKANRSKPKCTLYKPLKGGFSVTGTAALNSFKFSGRIENRALKPGAYRLVGRCGTTLKLKTFHIVR
jgi:hypothetical protein